ncbi:hypothetical protein BDR05DRAFT_1005470 [Suillus weaverae]|nr:hypothetical protein BDR05DRAFT_1005470 [Suillus weaverae]
MAQPEAHNIPAKPPPAHWINKEIAALVNHMYDNCMHADGSRGFRPPVYNSAVTILNNDPLLQSIRIGPAKTFKMYNIPHPQLEPTTRGSSEKAERALRLTKACQERKGFIQAFKEISIDAPEEELFVPVPHPNLCHYSVPNTSEISTEIPARDSPTSPITPSSKESVHGESSDDFEALDNPRRILPGSFLDSPIRVASSDASSSSTLSSLTQSSVSSCAQTPVQSITQPVNSGIFDTRTHLTQPNNR